VYEGQWQDDKRHGKGIATFANGNVYSGHWEADQRCGLGTLFHTAKGTRFDGLWANDQAKGGTYSEMEASPPGAPGALPVLELRHARAVVHAAVYVQS